jgi:hypothetical protein
MGVKMKARCWRTNIHLERDSKSTSTDVEPERWYKAGAVEEV